MQHLAVFQSGGFGTETKTFCVLFFVNMETIGIRAVLRRNLNLSMGFSETRRRPLFLSLLWRKYLIIHVPIQGATSEVVRGGNDSEETSAARRTRKTAVCDDRTNLLSFSDTCVVA
jgi:hypothetical protein